MPCPICTGALISKAAASTAAVLTAAKQVMILLDQIARYISKDIMLPTRCYATKKQRVSVKDCCDCKIFCKKPPKGSAPAVVLLKNKYP